MIKASIIILCLIWGSTQQQQWQTGQINVRQEKLFYILYGKLNPSMMANYPLTIVVGAPGRSSLYMNYGGLGPSFLRQNLTFIDNLYSINKESNVVFLDMIGSGFSFTANVENIPTTSEDYGTFLTEAINAFLSYARKKYGSFKGIYIISESISLRSFIGVDEIDDLRGVIHVGPWPDFYQVGQYYGVAGIQTHIFGQSQRIIVESTLQQCEKSQKNQEWETAHLCYDTLLKYIEDKTSNTNLQNIIVGSNLTDFVPLIQYYLSQNSTISLLNAPTQRLFESQSPKVLAQLYADIAKNYDAKITQYFKDHLQIKHLFITGDNDFISYRKAIKDWLENKVRFAESDKFKDLPLQEYIVDGETVGYTKAVKQVRYFQLLNAGHYSYHDQSKIFNGIISSFIKQLSINQETQQLQTQ